MTDYRYLIDNSGKTSKEIAAAVSTIIPGFSPAMLSYIVQGKLLPTKEQKEVILAVCGVDYKPRDADICKMTFRVPWWLRSAFNAICEAEGITQQHWLTETMYQYVKERGKKNV